ncbi:MAG: DUF4432 family protein [Alkalispirochaeta sp.]
MLHLPVYRDQFHRDERIILQYDEFEVSAFRFSTGVEALRLTNSAGELTVLPFQGQQIWDLQMFGRRQTMTSMFTEPRANVPFLRTYGGFLIHCGFTATGGPGPTDTHPLHGELPNISYDEAAIVGGEDEHGIYVGVTGSVEYAHAFGAHYRAVPEIRMYPRSGAIRVRFRGTNLNKTPMEYMYLCHVNFRPIDNARLIYSAPCDTDHVRVRDNVPAHLNVTQAYREFLSDLAQHPEKHNVLSPDLPFDPEAVLFVDMDADASGHAHSVQLHPTGEGDFISYRPAELDHAVRWICRTPNQAGLGLVLPATAEPDGYTAEKEKGNVKELSPGESFECDFFTGALSAPAAQRYAEHVEATLQGNADSLDPVALDAQSY